MSLDTTPETPPRRGYTLPVFACASAIAALKHLQAVSGSPPGSRRDGPTDSAPPLAVAVNLIVPEETVTLPIDQVASLPDGSAMAITRSDPGDNLDLTRHTPIWAIVAWGAPGQTEAVRLQGGEGVGYVQAEDRPAIYRYASRLLTENLTPYLPQGRTVTVTIVLPEGRSLALRTSNAAFGVVDGLSLLGTSGIAAPLSAPGQLAEFRQVVREKAAQFDTLVFCVGENGLDRALSLGIAPERRVKTANWIGPLLIEAALHGVTGILLLGYHGKLVKLAGGIFHTHHYVADGRQEVLTAIAASCGLGTDDIQKLLSAKTLEAGLNHLRQCDRDRGTGWVQQIYGTLVERMDTRAADYIQANCDRAVVVGSLLFDRQREIVAQSDRARSLLRSRLVS